LLYFDWDPQKEEQNKKIHGISFAAASTALEDPFALEEFDQIIDGEVRLRTTGMAAGEVVVVVVHTMNISTMGWTNWRVLYRQGKPVQAKGGTMSNYGRRAAGTPLSEAELEELRALAGKPDSEINFSDIPERVADVSGELQLEPHTITLRVDPQVAAWLREAGDSDASRINWLLRREARRRNAVSAPHDVLHQAS